MSVIPSSHCDLLERPLFAHLATTRADGTPQVTPMWYQWDGETVSFTTSTSRAKYQQIVNRPHVAMAIHDPLQPYRYLEIRGTVTEIVPDPNGDFFFELAERYHLPMKRGELGDAPHRVRIIVKPVKTTQQ